MSKLVLGSVGLCLFAFIGFACAGAPSADVAKGQLQGNGQGPDEYPYGCRTTDDCVVVETACCDHCNGGKAEAFNKAQADKYRPKDCGQTQCTARGCGEALAVCVEAKCQIEIKELLPPG